MNDMILNRNAKFAAFEKEINTLKFTLSNNVKENESLTTTIDVLKKQTKEKEDKYIEEIVDLEKKKKALDNIVYKVGQSVQTMHMLTKPQVFYDDNHKTALGYQIPFYLKKAQRIKPMLYDGSVLIKKHDVIYVVDFEETLMLAKESRSKMIVKQNNLISKEKRVNIYPINYVELNKLSEHFGKHFVPQRELSAEQAFWLPISNPISEQLVLPPTQVKTEVPCELPTTMCFEIQKKELLLENDRLLELIISQDLMHTTVNSLDVIVDYQSMEKSYVEEYNRNLTLAAELSKMNELSKTCSRLENRCISLELKLQQTKKLQAKESSIIKLRAHIATLKGKSVSNNNVSVNNTNVITPGMFRLDLEPLSLKLKKNMEARVYYLQETKEHTDSLRRILEQARALNLIDSHLDYAYKFTARIQELLVYVNET
ncbi:hypothetical protein Tco_1066403 [Tanacetum coccineum]|uniref:Uncharacterized protein n=1 Tax=Tanacetum coccineum TaxID=301880 RepID=A0ABQ5HBA6_9ASTR